MFKSWLPAAGLWILDAIAPPSCLFCDQSSPQNLPLCAACSNRLTPNSQPCPICALPDCKGSLCPACQAQASPLMIVSAPYVYDASVAYIIHRWKYQGERRLNNVAAHLMLAGGPAPQELDALLPVPLHWKRQLHRGFNQSEELIHALVKHAPALAEPASTELRLTRRRATAPQTTMSRAERQNNLGDAFSVRGNPENQVIAVVDDVCTTGATGRAIAQTLRRRGARKVYLWCLARTPAH